VASGRALKPFGADDALELLLEHELEHDTDSATTEVAEIGPDVLLRRQLKDIILGHEGRLLPTSRGWEAGVGFDHLGAFPRFFLPASFRQNYTILETRPRATLLGEELDGVMDVREQTETWLREEAGKVPTVKLISTAPGIGLIRASQIVAVVVCPERFRTSRQFWAYCGLAIVTRSSSDWVKDAEATGGWARKDVQQTRGLNRKRNPMLKSVFKGAALTVVQRQADHALTSHYMEMLKTTKPNLARLTIARKIAATVLAMWKNKEAYDPKRHDRPARS
jgi:hypothetical protein